MGVTGWNVSPSGVEFVTSLVADAMDDLAKDVKSYGKHVEGAAKWAGTLGDVSAACGGPAGPVGAALSLFVEKTAHDVLFLNERGAKSVNGAREATGYYLAGDLQMAADAQHKALSAPKVDLPGQNAGKGGHK
ncbi:DUF6507 family protein [Streptomyces avermitilis]|uniref:DUF6507 family protein n=1 Tax=Streptomyces avermitilis TaxID=33903 RepID=UPI00370F94E8